LWGSVADSMRERMQVRARGVEKYRKNNFRGVLKGGEGENDGWTRWGKFSRILYRKKKERGRMETFNCRRLS